MYCTLNCILHTILYTVYCPLHPDDRPYVSCGLESPATCPGLVDFQQFELINKVRAVLVVVVVLLVVVVVVVVAVGGSGDFQQFKLVNQIRVLEKKVCV